MSIKTRKIHRWMVDMVASTKVEQLTVNNPKDACWRVTFGDEKIPETIIECIRHGDYYARFHLQKFRGSSYKKTVAKRIKDQNGRTMIDAAITVHLESEYHKRGLAIQENI